MMICKRQKIQLRKPLRHFLTHRDQAERRARRGPLRQARLALAISAGKLVGASGRILGIGGGTSLPGMVARRIDPDVLKTVMRDSTAKKIVITGSNGKTTTSRMIAEMAKESGNRLSHNRSGSNLLQGVTSVAVNFASVSGELQSDVLVFEIDEGTMQHVIPEIQPDVVVITNIFRDQLDRFGELYAVARSLDKVLEGLPETSTIVLNGNDPQVANFGMNAKAKRVFFGLNTTEIGTPVPDISADVIRCIHCQEDLEYKVAYLSHLGLYRCPNCGYTLPELDIAATSVKLASDGKGPTHATLTTPAGELEIEIPLPGVHNVYNAAAAIGAALAAGFPKAKLPSALAKLQPAFGRLEEIKAGDQTIYLAFVKNPTSFNLIMRLIMQHPGCRCRPGGRAPARHRQSQCAARDHQQAGQAGEGMGDGEAASDEGALILSDIPGVSKLAMVASSSTIDVGKVRTPPRSTTVTNSISFRRSFPSVTPMTPSRRPGSITASRSRSTRQSAYCSLIAANPSTRSS